MSLDERVIAHSAALRSEHQCANCGAPVTGRFCSNCGQRLESPVHSVSHFVAEATEDLTHLDSRVWGTITALLFRPGFLTRKFLDGQRVRYLPPLRLYLVLSLMFFLVVTWWAATGSWLVGFSVSDDGTARPVVGCSQIQGVPESKIGKALRDACFRDNGRSLHDAAYKAISRAMFVSCRCSR